MRGVIVSFKDLNLGKTPPFICLTIKEHKGLQRTNGKKKIAAPEIDYIWTAIPNGGNGLNGFIRYSQHCQRHENVRNRLLRYSLK